MERFAPLRPALLSMLVVAAAITYAMQSSHAASTAMWGALLGAYLALAALSLVWKSSSPKPSLKPRWGDLSLGALLGFFTVAAAFMFVRWLAPPLNGRLAWLYRLYTQLGDVQRSGLSTALLLSIVALEELVWRRWVLAEMRVLSERWAAPLTALAYAVPHIPAAFVLSDPDLGLNPLLPLAALGCGLLWTYLTLLTNRLTPALIAHAVFTYFMSSPLPLL